MNNFLLLLLTLDLVVITDDEVKEWMRRNSWKRFAGGEIFIANQEENVKTKNIKENINFDSALLFHLFVVMMCRC